MQFFAQLMVSGIALGALYAIVAFGFVLVFKATSVLNFAHGALFMLGAFLASTFITQADYNPVVAFLLIIAILAAIGAVIHFGVMRGMVGQQLVVVVLATIGIEIVIKSFAQIEFGPVGRGRVTYLPDGLFKVAGVVVSWVDICTVGIALVLVGLLTLMFTRTRIGFQMRAVAENFEAARSVGISPQRVFVVSWILAAVLAGIGGAIYANFGSSVSLDISGIGLRVFPAALIGGLTSFPGAVVGGMLIGVTEQLAGGYLGGEWRDVAPYALMFILLIVRPYGIFGRRDAVRV